MKRGGKLQPTQATRDAGETTKNEAHPGNKYVKELREVDNLQPLKDAAYGCEYFTGEWNIQVAVSHETLVEPVPRVRGITDHGPKLNNIHAAGRRDVPDGTVEDWPAIQNKYE